MHVDVQAPNFALLSNGSFGFSRCKYNGYDEDTFKEALLNCVGRRVAATRDGKVSRGVIAGEPTGFLEGGAFRTTVESGGLEIFWRHYMNALDVRRPNKSLFGPPQPTRTVDRGPDPDLPDLLPVCIGESKFLIRLLDECCVVLLAFQRRRRQYCIGGNPGTLSRGHNTSRANWVPAPPVQECVLNFAASVKGQVKGRIPPDEQLRCFEPETTILARPQTTDAGRQAASAIRPEAAASIFHPPLPEDEIRKRNRQLDPNGIGAAIAQKRVPEANRTQIPNLHTQQLDASLSSLIVQEAYGVGVYKLGDSAETLVPNL
ncbi:hypothetical protein C8R45DRAFT_930312 [Mycena sanguinolenta]|nr:hypothetical protein C8R45DRAFT_930312 [Mycena sanguinolenta]